MDSARHAETERVLEATDLVRLIGEHISLQRKGREFVGLCPFHDDRSPSMHVVTHKGMHFYKCFACGASGNAFRFVMDYHNMTFPEALHFLAERANIELTPWQPSGDRLTTEAAEHASRQDLLAANALALQYYRSVFAHPQAGRAARAAAEKRGFSGDMTECFQIGAAPDSWDALGAFARKRGLDSRVLRAAGLTKPRSSGDGERDAFVNRLIFPICDQRGAPIGFGGRILNPNDIPKYLNSEDTPLFKKSRTLYAMHLARRPIIERKTAIVTEGYTDVIAMHQHGFTNCVATLGTALTEDHARMLARLCDTVVLLFDGDDAGQKAAEHAVEIFFAEPIDVRICILPDGCDPDELLRKADGRDLLQDHLDRAEDALPFLINRFRRGLDDVDSISGRQKALDDFLARLADLGIGRMSGLRKRMILPTLSHLLGVSIRDVESRIPHRRPRVNRRAERELEDQVEPADAAPEETAGAAVRGRVAAERDLLSILIFEPSVRGMPVEIDGYPLPIAEAYLPESFADPTCRAIYEAMHPYLEAEIDFNAAALEAQIESPSVRKQTYELYFRGRSLCACDEALAPQKLIEAAAALEDVCHRTETRERIRAIRQSTRAPGAGAMIMDEEKEDAGTTRANTPAFLEVLEARRALGDDRAAAPRGQRT